MHLRRIQIIKRECLVNRRNCALFNRDTQVETDDDFVDYRETVRIISVSAN
jgi:hypothetical protein